MAMSMNDQKMTARQSTGSRRQTARPVVPAVSREATARKLEPEMLTAEVEELDFETESPVARAKAAREAEARHQEKVQLIAKLSEKRDEYVERLDVGAAKIEEARGQGKDVTSWEDYWIQLLHQYEAVCDKLRDLHAEM